jgi:hypothetical protein
MTTMHKCCTQPDCASTDDGGSADCTWCELDVAALAAG